ncbi:MAG: pyridoxamine 5'-phosphate oxidase family protein [Acidimicrobiia bacterium]
MAFPPDELDEEAIRLLTDGRPLAMLATTRADGRPHLAAVGYTYDPERHLVHIVTQPGSQKVRNILAGSRAVIARSEAMVWLQVAGPASVHADPDLVHAAYERFAARYGRVHSGERFVVVEVAVTHCLSAQNTWGRRRAQPTDAA